MLIDAYLKHCRAFCPTLTDDDLMILKSGLSIRHIPARAVLTEQGQTQHEMGFVLRGLFKAVYTAADGKQVNVNFIREYMTVGNYRAFSHEQASRYRFVALESSTLVMLSYAHFERCCQLAPRLERLFRLKVEQALHGYIHRVESLLIANAEARYMDFIQREPALFERISLSDLCSYLGIERQSLTRIRKRLQSSIE